MINLGLSLEAGAVVMIKAAVEAVMVVVLLLRVMGMILGTRRGLGATSGIYR